MVLAELMLGQSMRVFDLFRFSTFICLGKKTTISGLPLYSSKKPVTDSSWPSNDLISGKREMFS
jgi:hypothetical protein